jgi:hypothetical protein
MKSRVLEKTTLTSARPTLGVDGATTAAPAVLADCCASCRFRAKDSTCHYGPPVYSLHQQSCRNWPPVLGTDWCGRYERKQ